MERQEPVEISEKKNYVLANLRTVAKMLLYFSQSGPDYEAKGLPCVRLFELVVMIICILLSNTVLFLEIMLVIVMLRLVFLPNDCQGNDGETFKAYGSIIAGAYAESDFAQ